MDRQFKDKQIFIAYDQNEGAEFPRLLQIINKDDLAWQIEISKTGFSFYAINTSNIVESEKKLYISGLINYKYHFFIGEDIYVVEDDNRNYHTDNNATVVVDSLGYKNYAVEIGNYGSIRFFNPNEKKEEIYVESSQGQEWFLSKEDCNNMDIYDRYCYVEAMGNMPGWGIYTDEIKELVDEQYEIKNEGDFEEYRNEINSYSKIIDKKMFEEFKKMDMGGPEENKIPRAYLVTYLEEINLKKRKIDSLLIDLKSKINEEEEELIRINKIIEQMKFY